MSRTPSTTVGPGGAAAVSDKVALKQHATLRKHVLIADPSLAGEDKLLEKVMAVMKDTWSWDELKKFILRKADMKENVEATVDLIRDDMDDEDEDEDEPADGAAARQSSEECEIAEPAAVVQPAKAPIEVKLEPCPASDVAMADATDGAAAPPAPATAIPARAPSPPPAAPDPSSAAPSAFVPPVVVQQQQQQHAAAPAPPPSAAASGPASKKKPSKNLPAEERERLARERVLAQGKVWIEPAKKKAMTALRQESGAQIQRGEFKEFEAQDEVRCTAQPCLRSVAPALTGRFSTCRTGAGTSRSGRSPTCASRSGARSSRSCSRATCAPRPAVSPAFLAQSQTPA